MAKAQYNIDGGLKQIRALLDEHGPLSIPQMAKKLGWHIEHVRACTRKKPSPDWLVGAGYTKATKGWNKVIAYGSTGEHQTGYCVVCSEKLFTARNVKECQPCKMKRRAMEKEGEKFTEAELAEIRPWEPTDGAPGSETKILVLSARYETGIHPIWHPDDRKDHEGARDKVAPSFMDDFDDDEWEAA